jgi:hypothetical protein
LLRASGDHFDRAFVEIVLPRDSLKLIALCNKPLNEIIIEHRGTSGLLSPHLTARERDFRLALQIPQGSVRGFVRPLRLFEALAPAFRDRFARRFNGLNVASVKPCSSFGIEPVVIGKFEKIQKQARAVLLEPVYLDADLFRLVKATAVQSAGRQVFGNLSVTTPDVSGHLVASCAFVELHEPFTL